MMGNVAIQTFGSSNYLKVVEVRACSNGNLVWCVALILSVVCEYRNLLCTCESMKVNHVQNVRQIL